MANVVEILIKAKDDASRVLKQVGGNTVLMGAAAGAAAAVTLRLTQALEQMAAAAAGAPFALADTVEQLDRLASRTGASSEKLQVMQQVIREGGGNAEALTTALTFLNRAIANQNPILAQMGITTTDAFEAMMQLGRAFSHSEDTAKKNAIAFALLGRGGGELIADLNNLVTTFDETNARMRISGSLITDSMAPAARRLDEQMDRLADNWAGSWTRMQAALVGPANMLLTVTNALLDFNSALAGAKVLGFLTGQTFGTQKGSFGTRDRDLHQGSVDLTKIETGDKKEESPRAKRLKDLQRILGQTAVEAERTLKALEAIEDKQKAQAVRDALRSDTDIAARTDTSADTKLRERERAKIEIDEIRRVPELQLDALTRVREQWLAFAADVLSTASILNGAIGALHSGLEAGFSTVFANLLTEGQTFKSAFLTIINSLVEAALAELARIAAAKAIVGIIGLIAGGPAGGAAAAGVLTSAGRAPEGAVNAGRTTIININALDIKSGLDALVTPFGATRAVQARTAEAFG